MMSQGRVLYIEGLNGHGERFKLYYDRERALWVKDRAQCLGYSADHIADGQLTRFRKVNFNLNSNFEVYVWGWSNED